MDPMRLFPEVDGLEKAREAWEIEPLPHPKIDLGCPVCRRGTTRAGTILLRGWNYFTRGNRASNQDRLRRCDVSFKCLVCSAVWTHGVVVPELHYQERAQRRRHWHWRDGRALFIEKARGVASA